jgi:hypothetical protein
MGRTQIAFESRTSRKIIGLNGEKVTGGRRKLHSGKLHNLYSSLYYKLIRQIKLRMKLTDHGKCTVNASRREKRMKGRDYSGILYFSILLQKHRVVARCTPTTRFGRMYYLHIQDGRVSHASNHQEPSRKQSAMLFLALLILRPRNWWRYSSETSGYFRNPLAQPVCRDVQFITQNKTGFRYHTLWLSNFQTLKCRFLPARQHYTNSVFTVPHRSNSESELL